MISDLEIKIKQIEAEDYPQLVEIYKQGIETGIATFQTEPLDWEVWDREHLESCRVAAFDDQVMAGWVALTPVSGRCVYAGVAEVSIYIAQNYRGKGVGKYLLQQLINESEAQGLWTLQSGIFAENKSSIKLHESCGFRMVGLREKIGKLNGTWKDIVMMERRSRTIGQQQYK